VSVLYGQIVGGIWEIQLLTFAICANGKPPVEKKSPHREGGTKNSPAAAAQVTKMSNRAFEGGACSALRKKEKSVSLS